VNGFDRKVELMVARQEARAAALAEMVRTFVQPEGGERVLDVGTGTGALALALAPLVREVVGVDREPALLEKAREQAPENATFLEGDATALPFPDAAFDLTATVRTLHHVHRPELAVAELTRVTRPQGRVLVVDQLAPLDPLEALELDRFERTRAPDHERLLSDQDMRGLFDANRLALIREEHFPETRELQEFLDLAGCEGEAREAAAALGPQNPVIEIGWYLLRRP
jgi:ubiquinone/menaquinone biosynthesis C-methylase UbiE